MTKPGEQTGKPVPFEEAPGIWTCPACETSESSAEALEGHLCPGFRVPSAAPVVTAKCQHENFAANVDCNRLTDADGAKVIGYSADVRINCRDCGLPFEFVGVNAGSSPRKPMCDVSAQELRIPIRPKGCNIMPGIPGFEVKAQ